MTGRGASSKAVPLLSFPLQRKAFSFAPQTAERCKQAFLCGATERANVINMGLKMQAIEFREQLCEGMINLPSQFRTWKNRQVRVILLAEEIEPTIPAKPENLENRFDAVSLKTKGFRFNREKVLLNTSKEYRIIPRQSQGIPHEI
jgi:hypothetical protein